RPVAHEASLDGGALVISLAEPAVAQTAPGGQVAHFAEGKAEAKHAIRDIDFRRGRSGEGRVVVDLSDTTTGIDIRQQGQNVIADFTDLNIITSDTVTGNITLRLKDVPWDQALEIILLTRGLDSRRSGNVVWIAPRDELATREKLALEATQQINDLEQTRTESFQMNYQKAADVQKLLSDP